MTTQQKSNCCRADISTSFGEEGTNSYVCSHCFHACDPYVEESAQSNYLKVGRMIECSNCHPVPCTCMCHDEKQMIENWEKEFDTRFHDIFGHGGEDIIKGFICSLLATREKQIKEELVKRLPREESLLRDAAYSGGDLPKSYIKERIPYEKGFNDCLNQIKSLIETL